MAIIWHVTAGPISAAHPEGVNGWLGALYESQANPAVQSTEPRPEWYFLFLFELLRIFKEPWQLIFATIIIPTILMVLLIMWPFIDRGRDRRLSRRPWGVAIGLATPCRADRPDDRGQRGAGSRRPARTSPETRRSTPCRRRP